MHFEVPPLYPQTSYHDVMSPSLSSFLDFLLFLWQVETLSVIDSCGMGTWADFYDNKIVWSSFTMQYLRLVQDCTLWLPCIIHLRRKYDNNFLWGKHEGAIKSAITALYYVLKGAQAWDIRERFFNTNQRPMVRWVGDWRKKLKFRKLESLF